MGELGTRDLRKAGVIGGCSKGKNPKLATKSEQRRRVDQRLAPPRWYSKVRQIWDIDRFGLERTGVFHAEHPRAGRVPPDAYLFDRLCTIARVPASGAPRLRQRVLWEINEAWGFPLDPAKTTDEGREFLNRRHVEVRTEESSTAAGLLNRARVQLRCMEKSSRALCADLQQKNLLTSLFLEGTSSSSMYPVSWGPDGEEGGFSFGLFEKMITEFAALVSRARQDSQDFRSSGSRGRPARDSLWGAMSVSKLTKLTLRLLWDVRETGGHLTIDKNAHSGTLIEMLDLLRQYLPPKRIPNQLPFSTLAGIKVLENKIECPQKKPRRFEHRRPV